MNSSSQEKCDESKIANELKNELPHEISRLPISPRLKILTRYYDIYYYLDVCGKLRHDQYLYMNPNRLCVVGIAPTHVLLQENRKVIKVNFSVNQRNVSQGQVQRKRKRNGKKPTFVHPQSCLAEITCSDNTSYFVYSCISGKLVELNDTLLTNPHLVSEKPESEGFIAILIPKDVDIRGLTMQQYLQTRNITTINNQMNDNTNNNNNSNQNNNHNEVKEQHTDSLKCQIQCQENNVVMKPKESN